MLRLRRMQTPNPKPETQVLSELGGTKNGCSRSMLGFRKRGMLQLTRMKTLNPRSSSSFETLIVSRSSSSSENPNPCNHSGAAARVKKLFQLALKPLIVAITPGLTRFKKLFSLSNPNRCNHTRAGGGFGSSQEGTRWFLFSSHGSVFLCVRVC